MSGECESCGSHALECTCKGDYQESSQHWKHFWKNRTKVKHLIMDELGGIDPPAEIPPRREVNVKGRVEHEAVIKDAEKCKELGLDQYYEIMVYLNRWGGWLNDEK